MRKKGQGSLEQMLVTAIALTFITAIFYFAMNYATDNIRTAQARDTINKIGNAADYAYSLGPNSKTKVDLYMPSEVQYINTSGSRIQIHFLTASGESDVFVNTRAPVVGIIPTTPGKQTLQISLTDTGKIQVGTSLLSCSPNSITKTIAQGGTSSANSSVTNSGDTTISGIIAVLSGNVNDMLSITQPASTLNPGNSSNIDLSFSVASNKTTGTYSGLISVNGNNSSECSTSITIFVVNSTPNDILGPSITALNYSPSNPITTDSITINATGSDLNLGNNTIASCAVQVDGGAFYGMLAVGTPYNSAIIQNVTYNIGTLSAGSHTIGVRCTDSIGNVGNTSTTTITVSGLDTTGPIITAFSILPINATDNQTISVNATGSDLTTGNHSVALCQIQLDNGSFSSMTAVGTAYNTSVTQNVNYSLGVLSVGNHTVGVRCTDSLGNVGSTNSTTIEVVSSDVLGPTVTALSFSPLSPTYLQNITVNATGSDLNLGNHTISMCQIQIDGGNFSNMTALSTNYSTSITQNVTYNVGNLSLGNHTVGVRCIDSIGNIGSTNSTNITVVNPDNLGPSVTALSSSPASPTYLQNITINATGSDLNLGNNTVTMCQLQLDSGSFSNMTAVGTAYNTSITQNVSYLLGTLSIGTHVVGVKCTDSVGNVGNLTNLSISVTDPTGPIITALSTSPISPTNLQNITVNATGSDLTTGGSNISMCQVRLDSGSFNNMTATGTSYGTSITQNTTYNLGNISAGSHNVSVRCIDSLGNIGSTNTTTITVTTADVTGPIITALSTSPVNATVFSNITVNATGSDATTGNNNVSMCQLQLDGGSFNNMTAVGTYNTSVTQAVTYSLGTLSKGTHTIGVRCIDSLGNVGSTNTTNITISRKSILLLTQSAAPNTAEQRWITWIQGHSSALGLDWSMDNYGRASLTGGSINASNYRIVIMPTASNSDPTLYSMLTTYKNGGNYVVLVGGALQFGIARLGVGTGSGSTSNNQVNMKIQSPHYITTGFTNGSTYVIESGNSRFAYHTATTMTNLGSTTANNNRGMLQIGSNVIVFGSDRPDLFNANGNTFATRVIDYALNNSASN